MKTTFVLVMSVLIFPAAYSGQNCKAFTLNKGQRLSYEHKTFPLTFESDPSMITGDTKYKTKKSIEFNQKIADGKIAPKKTASMVAKVNDITSQGGKTVYHLDADGLGTAVDFNYYCSGDSLVTVLYKGRMAYAPKGDTAGIMLFGALCYPSEPKVGSRIKGTCNVTALCGPGQAVPLRRGFNMPFNAASTSAPDFYREFTNLGPLEGTYYSFSLSQPALVIREEKMNVLGKEHTAFVIGTETWMKGAAKMEASFPEMEQKYLQSPDMSKDVLKEPSFEAGGKRLWKKGGDEMIDVNKYGFMLTYKEEWFVTGLGVVKTINYDGNGAIIAMMELKSIE